MRTFREADEHGCKHELVHALASHGIKLQIGDELEDEQRVVEKLHIRLAARLAPLRLVENHLLECEL